MTEHPENPLAEGKAAYVKAQKKRNLFIGLGLAAFVVLVFFISMARMSQGIKSDAVKSAEARASLSAVSSQSGH